MEALAAIGGITSAGLAITVALLALRLSGAKSEAADADRKREISNKQLKETANELFDTKKRSRRQLADLRSDIRESQKDLSECSVPGATRDRLERMLSKAADRPNGSDAPRLLG